MQSSSSLMGRCSAAAASEVSAGSAEGDTRYLASWMSARSWDLAATPGWADAWESAEAGGITDPGDNEGVITDSMILSRTQQLLALYPLSTGETSTT
jgi:hypothetical protein